MRQSIGLFFIALIVMSSATQVNDDIAYLKSMGQSEFGKTLIESIQIELKSSEGNDSVDRIVHLLKDLQRSINAEAAADLKAHRAKEAACKKSAASLRAQIADLQNSIKTDQALVVSNHAKSVAHRRQLALERAGRNSDRLQLAANLALQKKTTATYQSEFTRLANQITALARARSFIAQLVNSFAETQAGSFVEISSDLKNIQFQHEKYQGFINVLAQLLGSQHVADQAGVKKILSLIDSLSAALFRESQLLTRIYNRRMKNLRGAERRLRKSLASHIKNIAYEKATLAQLKASTVAAKQRIRTNQQSLASRQQELKNLLKDCADARAAYRSRVVRRNGELVIVQRVLVIFANNFSAAVRHAVGLM